MKQLLTLFLIVFANGSCSSSADKQLTTIKGKVQGLSGGQVFLEELTFTGKTPIDTGSIDQQGAFSVRAKIPHLGLYQLRFDQRAVALLILEEQSSTITLTADTATLRSFQYQISGSPSSERLRQLMATTKRLTDGIQKAMNEYNQLPDTASLATRNTIASRLMKADSAFRTYLRQFADTAQHPVLALFAISSLDINNDWATFEKLEQRLKNVQQPLPLLQSFTVMMTDQRGAKKNDLYAPRFKIGDAVPDIEMAGPDGQIYRLSSLKGKIVLLDFWASWCGPCRIENPNIVRAYQKFRDKGFTVFSVSLDVDKNRWLSAIEKDSLSWPYHTSELKGWQSPICQVYGIRSIPASYLLDREGKVIAINPRGMALEQALDQIFQ